jgi:hypothetical protein
MISKFQYIANEDIVLDVNLGVTVIFFEGNDDNLISSYYRSKSKGILWEYNDKEIRIINDDYFIEGLPTPDLQKVIVIYPMDHGTYPAPNNAVIHNGDGSVFKQLSPPTLVSDLAKEQHERKPNGPYLLYFRNVFWANNKAGEVVACISIAYNRDWHEDRELNTETGEFGECLNSGRR